MTELLILSDNRPTPFESPLLCEHGLSIYIEFDGLKILCDMGSSSLYSQNGELMGVDLDDLDFALISHSHNDHSGGLRHFLEHYSCDVYLSDKIQNHTFHSQRSGTQRNISHDNTLFESHAPRLHQLSESTWITDRVAIVTNFTTKYPTPQGNAHLTVDHQPDRFDHELALLLSTEQGLVIVSPCSHSGAANIIESCRDFTGERNVATFIGGLHFVNHAAGTTTGYDEVVQFTRTMSKVAPDTQIITGHCTASEAEEHLKKLFPPEDLQFFYCGAAIEL